MALPLSSSRLAWLAAALSDRRERIAGMLRQISGLGVRGAMSPPAFGRFLHLLDEIAVERQGEERLLDRIVSIEAQHRQRRINHQLQPAVDAARQPDKDMPHHHQPLKPKHRVLWLLLIYYWLRMRVK